VCPKAAYQPVLGKRQRLLHSFEAGRRMIGIASSDHLTPEGNLGAQQGFGAIAVFVDPVRSILLPVSPVAHDGFPCGRRVQLDALRLRSTLWPAGLRVLDAAGPPVDALRPAQ
jgi:hypothetical protein